MDTTNSSNSLLDIIRNIVQVEWLSVLILIVIVFICTSIIARIVSQLLRRMLDGENSSLHSPSIFINIGRGVVWAFGISVILSTCFDIDISALIAALGIGGIAISLGFQDTLSNLIGGLQVSVTGLVRPGDHVDVGGQRGIVRDVTWRHTTIETLFGECVVVPNAAINNTTLIKLPPLNKIVVPISVITRGDGLETIALAIEEAAERAVREVGDIQKAPEVSFTDVTEFGYTGSVVVWMSDGVDVLAAKDAIVRAVAPLTRHELDIHTGSAADKESDRPKSRNAAS